MNAYVGELSTSYDPSDIAEAATKHYSPVIDNEAWGFAIRAVATESRSNALTMAASRFAGSVLLVCAAALWAAPGVAAGPEFVAMKLGATVAFVLLGGSLFWRGRGETGAETQVDTARGQFRFGGRTLKGAFKNRGMVEFDQVDSLYLAPREGNVPACLYLRLSDKSQAVALAEGPTASMEILKKRIEMDMSIRKGAGMDILGV